MIILTQRRDIISEFHRIPLKILNFNEMKKIIPFLFTVLFLYSCQQTELQFSCDPVIDAYVTENRDELAQLTVHEVTVYELPLQRAIFASWSAEKKRNVWLDKLHYVMENEPLIEAEIGHIQDLIDHVVPGYFEESTVEQEKSERYAFAEKWQHYASIVLGWPESYIGFLVFRLYTSPSQITAEKDLLEAIKMSVVTDTELNCDCNGTDDFCQNADCGSGECSSTQFGCGWLFMDSCNGICS